MITTEQLERANKGLSHCRIVLKPGYQTLCLKATLPPKPGQEGKRRQQIISIKCKATGPGLKVAKAHAQRLDSELALNRFAWENWGYRQKQAAQSRPLDGFIAIKRSQIQPSSLSLYLPIVGQIEQLGGELTTEQLVALVRDRSEDHSKNRKTWCQVCAQVAEYLGLDPKPIRAIAGRYQAKPVNPSDLPTDDQIIEIWEGMGEHWQWFYGMMATYGLRPHECFHVDTEVRQGTLIANVRKETKTGARIVLPLPGEWCDRFNLASKRLPDIITEGRDNRRLSERISLRFRDKQVPHTPKALRHAYSCRGARYGIQPDVMARMMGHSISVHCKTYQAAISLTQYQAVFAQAESLINRS